MVAVTAGDGMRRLYEQLGAYVVEGGATPNPSTFELLAGIHARPADQVVVLPNSGNVIMAADRAAELSEKEVVVVESRWPRPGLASLVEHDPHAAASRTRPHARVLAGLRVGAVAPAARDDKRGRFRAGDAVGFLDEDIVAWGSPADTVREVFEQLAADAEILTVVSGAGAPLDGDDDPEPGARWRRGGEPPGRPAALLVAGGGRVARRRYLPHNGVCRLGLPVKLW